MQAPTSKKEDATSSSTRQAVQSSDHLRKWRITACRGKPGDTFTVQVVEAAIAAVEAALCDITRLIAVLVRHVVERAAFGTGVRAVCVT
jgi:hypothetical protein